MRLKKLVLIYFLCFLALGALSYIRIFDNYELSTLDLRFSLRPDQPQNDDIVIIEIADDSIEKIGRWPFSRDWHASLINILSFYGAKAVVFDVIFSEPSPADDSLIESTKKAGNVYYAFSFDLPQAVKGELIEAGKIKTPILDELKNTAKGAGHINVLADIDGKTRRISPFIKYKNKLYPHLGFLAVCDYLGKDPDSVYSYLPLDEQSNMLINYAGRWPDTFKHYSYVDILKSFALEQRQEKGTINLRELKGKVCFVGLTATALHDLNPVPLERRYPAIGVHLNTFNTIATKNFLRRASRLINVAILLVFSILVGLLTLKLAARKALILVLVLLLSFILIGIGLFVFLGIWIDLFYPVITLFVIYLALTSYRYLLEIQKRQLIERELSVATKIQASFLPENPPNIEGIALSADMNAAKQVGGDLYDFVEFGGRRVGVMIGDVSGKGVPAALYMARTISEFRLFSTLGGDPKEVISKLNESLVRESRANLFVTFSYLVYDGESKKLSFVNGGHNPTILVRREETGLRYLETKEGMPLGMMDSEFGQEEVTLSRGDKLILYTDGVTEAKSLKHEEFGDKRLSDLILANRGLDADKLLLEIKNSIARFAKRAPQHDDITIIVLEVKE